MNEMFFEQEKIEEILEKTNLKNLIKDETLEMSDYEFGLEKKNDVTYAKECPFCRSKKPAMMVNEKQYYCSSCGRGGNAIDFIMRILNKNFVDAVMYLAKRNSIKLELPSIKQQAVYSRKNTTLYNIYQHAAKFYFDKLRTKDGKVGMKYFNDRKVSAVIRSGFGLGYAGEFGDDLYRYLKGKGYKDTDLLESGLIAKSTKDQTQPYYDKFWSRVMFPILNSDGRVIAFGGRIMGDKKPKYLNSQETPIFNKGKNLYCYHIAKKSKLPYYICCEGFMDAISLHQFGFDNAVASLGTALTREQIQLLSTKDEIILAYDSDEAGIKAAKKAIRLCREVNLKIRVLQMNGAKDPDEFLKKFGKDAFEKLIRNAETDKHFLIRNSKHQNGKFNFDEAVDELF